MKIMAANRLRDGQAVWFSAELGWVETIHEADLARDKGAEERLEAAARAGKQNNEIVDPELIDVALVEGRIVPQRLRERIRAAGPTIRPDLGKQARPTLARAA